MIKGTMVLALLATMASVFSCSAPVPTQPAATSHVAALLFPNSFRTRGSAVRIHQDLLVTAAHVVSGPGELVFFRCGSLDVLLGIVTKYSQPLDLALVEFEGSTGNCNTEITDLASSDPAVGEKLEAVGFHNGRILAVMAGTVAAYEIIQTETGPRYSLLSEALIYPGCSGGPVLSERTHKLIGVITGRLCFSEEGQPPECLLTSVPISLVRAFLRVSSPSTVSPSSTPAP